MRASLRFAIPVFLLTLGAALLLRKGPPDGHGVPTTTSQPSSIITPTKISRLSDHQIIAIALNDITESGDAIRLENPKHTVEFSQQEGLTFVPKFSQLSWNWQLSHFGSLDQNWLNGSRPKPSARQADVDFDYGPFTERYLAKSDAIEQRFVLHQQPEQLRDGDDLVIRGAVTCDAEFDDSRSEVGWVWRGSGERDEVSLGQVTVFDASGEVLPATMNASARGTEIVVDGTALLAANYPVTVDPEIGANDIVLASATTDGDAESHEWPAIAYNPDDDQFCVVWLKGHGDSWEVKAQRIDAGTGLLVGQVTHVASFATRARPAIVYDGSHFVVAYAIHRNGETPVGVVERFEPQSNGSVEFTSLPVADGESIALSADGAGGYLISWIDDAAIARCTAVVAGSDGFSDSVVLDQDVDAIGATGNATRREHCVVWTSGAGVIAQRVDDTGALVDSEFVVAPSVSGPVIPRVTYNPQAEEYLFVWAGDDVGGRIVSGFFSPRTAPFVIRSVGAGVTVSNPSVAHSPEDGSYVATWAEGSVIRAAQVEQLTGALIETGFAISGGACFDGVIANAAHGGEDRLFAACTQSYDSGSDMKDRPLLGVSFTIENDALTLTDQPTVVFGIADPTLTSTEPSVAYCAAEGHYVIVWAQEVDEPGDWHILGRTTTATGTVKGRIINVSAGFNASTAPLLNQRHPDVAVLNNGHALVVWQGEYEVEQFGSPDVLKREIFGIIWNTAPGQLFLADKILLSETGDYFSANGLRAESPTVSANHTEGDFLLVWSATGTASDTQGGNPEIYARQVDGADISDLGDIQQLSPNSAGLVPSTEPAIAWNSIANDYLVVWSGWVFDGFTTSSREKEIVARRVSAAGDPLGEEKRVSVMGPFNNATFSADSPDIAFDGLRNKYLAVWVGQDVSVIDTEVYGQLLRPDGSRDGLEIQISEMGVGGAIANRWVPSSPSVSIVPHIDEYFVAWSSNHVLAGMGSGEREIFVREVSSAGGVQTQQQRISDLGPDGDSDFDANGSVIANDGNSYLVVFDGNDDRHEFSADRSAIFGQRFGESEAMFLRDLQIEIIGSDVHLSWQAAAGTPYRVQASVDLQTWSDITATMTATDGENQFVDVSGVASGNRMYRLRIPE